MSGEQLERVPWRLTNSKNFEAITQSMQAIHENSRSECRVTITVFLTLAIVYCLPQLV